MQAVAGSAGEIGIISLVEARVVSLITGTLVCAAGGPTVGMQCCDTRPPNMRGDRPLQLLLLP